jgi:hypothetical protein
MPNDFYQRFNLNHHLSLYRFSPFIDIMLCSAISLKRRSDFSESLPKSIMIRKDAQEFMEYQHPESAVRRDILNDRVFPLETVELQRVRRENDCDIDRPVHIHYGPASDEWARSFNALAFAIGYDIFFRNNSYQPESEAGRKLLSHEVMHVAQYAEGKITGNADEDELEAEADLAERRAAPHDEFWIPVEACGKIFWIQKNEKEKFINLILDKLKRKIEDRKYTLDERKYLEFLCKVERFFHMI